MYQSVMAKRQGAGTSGTGFAFVLATIKEINPEQNICLAQDLQTSDQYQVGLNKRGTLAWPNVGDTWILDRSLGHWALRTKVTANTAPPFNGDIALMDYASLQLLDVLSQLGLVTDQTISGDPLVITGSRNRIAPEVQAIIGILVSIGLVVDETTPETYPIDTWTEVASASLISPFQNYGGIYQPFRYMLDRNGCTVIEGVIKTTTTVSGSPTIFTLPNSDLFPKKAQIFTAQLNATSSIGIEITSVGTILMLNAPASTTVSYLSMGMRFSTA